ncbi:MAG: hypothetical protein B6244_00795 [Candidatus Cloacimonetes bacterium 4572_55]|nr:MAG: hypothetical protein B6244_00795 [Candidatus Cloacimonetes bacterium 4572_55]
MVSPANGSRFQHSDSDLFLMFYGFSCHNWVSVGGNSRSLEQGNLHLGKNYTHDDRVSLLLNGQLFGAFRVDLNAVYDTRLRDYPGNRDRSDFRFRLGLGMTESVTDERSLGSGFRLETLAAYEGNADWRIEDTDKRLLTEPFADLQFELFAKLSYHAQWVALGDQRISLEDTKFTLLNRNLLAVQLHLERDFGKDPSADRADFSTQLEGNLIAAKVKGRSFTEEDIEASAGVDTAGIRADGGSGPYYLTHTPATRGSELILVQVRDRYNPEIILSENVQRRGTDYTIDYERGLVIFENPIPSEDLSGNPRYIVIQYDYKYNGKGNYNRYLMGGQTRVRVGDESYIGVNYATEFDDDNSWDWSDSYMDAVQTEADSLGVSVDLLMKRDNPPLSSDHNVRSINSRMVFGETVLTGEIAQSDIFFSENGSGENHGDKNHAVRAELASYLRPGIEFKSSYWRVDREYQAIGDPNLDTDKEKWRVYGDFEYQDNQFLTAEYRNDSNIDYSDSSDVRTDQIIRFGWREEIPDIPHIKIQIERREQNNRFNSEDKTRQTARSELKHALFSQKINLNIGHEYEHFDDHISTASNSRQMARFGIEWLPVDRFTATLNQRVEFRLDQETDRYVERQDASKLSGQWRPIQGLEARCSFEYRRFGADFDGLKWKNDADRDEKSSSISLSFDLSDQSVNRLKYENRRALSYGSGPRNESQKQYLRNQLIYYLTPDLHLNVIGEIEDLQTWNADVYERTLLKRALFESNYHIFLKLDGFVGYEWREWEDHRFASSTSRTQRALFGVRYYFLPSLYARLNLRRASTELLGNTSAEPMIQNRAGIELGSDIKMNFRGAIGYEFVTYQNKEYSTDDYDASRFYSKLSVKF